jgi:hypothetical protein
MRTPLIRIGFCYRIALSAVIFICTSLLARSQWTAPYGPGVINNTNSGPVGINITNPIISLHVLGPLAATNYNGTTMNGFVESWADNAIIWMRGNQNAGLRFGSADNLLAGGWAEHIRMTDDGSLAIGTSTPRTKLDVWGGNVSVTGADFQGTLVGGAQQGIAYVGCNFLSNGLAIRPDGTVGIGTINVGSNKLAVEGTIGARKVVVTATNPFPDYVFNSTYPLTPLDSLAQYILLYHHLPDIPSADSVAKNGINLGDNQEALLKKVEELTLYIIQQNQEKKAQDLKLQAQDDELQLLKKRMQKVEEHGRK